MPSPLFPQQSSTKMLKNPIFLSTFLLLVISSSINAQQHHSFASTKFDLSPSLPIEDPVQVSAQLDTRPHKNPAHPKPHRKHHVTKPVEAVPTSAASLPNRQGEGTATSQPQPAQQTLVPLRTLAPVAPGFVSVTPPTLPPFTPFTLATIAPLIPQQESQPSQGFAPQPTQFQQVGGQQQGHQFNAQQQGNQFNGQQTQGQTPDVQLIHGATITERVDLWFRENYDTTICKRDSRFMANEFRLKFPANLWKGGKELLLADLLAARLNDCFTKQESNHWKRVDELISGLNLATTEEEECRTGLIQEQISCDNVFSYTCQFIQKAYNFRLVPTRLIIQEARIAEDGAEKCRKVVRKIKKDLQG